MVYSVLLLFLFLSFRLAGARALLCVVSVPPRSFIFPDSPLSRVVGENCALTTGLLQPAPSGFAWYSACVPESPLLIRMPVLLDQGPR